MVDDDRVGDEQALIAELATPAPAEQSWEAVARMRRLAAVLDDVLRRVTPQAIEDARRNDVTNAELAKAWNVTPTWIYTVRPARRK
jgi:hypothetical protein